VVAISEQNVAEEQVSVSMVDPDVPTFEDEQVYKKIIILTKCVFVLYYFDFIVL
jgi:hypothetical protein